MSIEVGYRGKILIELEAIAQENKNMAVVSKYTNNLSDAEEYLVKSECAMAIIVYMQKCPTANGTAIIGEINRLVQEYGGASEDGSLQYTLTQLDYKRRCEYLALHKLVTEIIEKECGFSVAPSDTVYNKMVAQMLRTEKNLINALPQDSGEESLRSEIRAQLVQTSEILIYLGSVNEISDVLFAQGLKEWIALKKQQLNLGITDIKQSFKIRATYKARLEFLATIHEYLEFVETENRKRLQSF